MRTKIEKIINLMAEFCLLAIVFFVPLYFALFLKDANVFELDKLVLFKILALFLLLLTLIKLTFCYHLNILKIKRVFSQNIKYLIIPAVFLLAISLAAFFSCNKEISFFGSYERQQGLSGLLYYFLFFILLLINLSGGDDGSDDSEKLNISTRLQPAIKSLLKQGGNKDNHAAVFYKETAGDNNYYQSQSELELPLRQKGESAAASINFGFPVKPGMTENDSRLLKKINRIIFAAALSSFFICVYGLVQAAGFDPLNWIEESRLRITGTFGQPNFFASYLLLVIPLSVYLFSIAKKFLLKFACLILSMSQLLCLYFTYSRAGWIGLIIELIVLLAYIFICSKRTDRAAVLCGETAAGRKIKISTRLQPAVKSLLKQGGNKNNCAVLCGEITARQKPKLKPGRILSAGRIILVFCAAFFMVFSALFFYSPKFKSRVKNTVNFQSGSVASRVDYWRASWQAIRQKPFFGYGPESQKEILVRYYEKDWAVNGFVNSYPDRAHNLVLDTLLTGGIVSLLAYAALLYLFFKLVFENMDIFRRSLLRKGCGGAEINISTRLQPAIKSLLKQGENNNEADVEQGENNNEETDAKQKLSAALAIGMAGYLTSLMFGFSVVATDVYFWLYFALIVIINRDITMKIATARNAQSRGFGTERLLRGGEQGRIVLFLKGLDLKISTRLQPAIKNLLRQGGNQDNHTAINHANRELPKKHATSVIPAQAGICQEISKGNTLNPTSAGMAETKKFFNYIIQRNKLSFAHYFSCWSRSLTRDIVKGYHTPANSRVRDPARTAKLKFLYDKIFLTIAKTAFVVLIAVAIFWQSNKEINNLVADHYFRELQLSYVNREYFKAYVLYDYIKDTGVKMDYYDRQFAEMLSQKMDDDDFQVIVLTRTGANLLKELVKNINSNDYFDSFIRAEVYTALANEKEPEYFALAEKNFAKAIALVPNMPKNYSEAGRMFAKKGEYDKAFEYFNKALLLLPDLQNKALDKTHQDKIKIERYLIYKGIADMRFKQKLYAEAEKNYRLAYENNIQDINLFKKIANIYIEKGDIDRAIWYNKRGMARNPSDYSWPHSIALLYREKGDKENALAFAKKALELSPENAETISFINEISK